MTDLLLRPLADAFMQVGVFVAALVAPFGWARMRWGNRVDHFLIRHRRLGPLVGAALTMPPGCGGAIIVMAIYARGYASYGTAIAALVATMGDATWVLLAAEPVLAVQLKALLLVAGSLSGYAVDLLGIKPRQRVDRVSSTSAPAGGGRALQACKARTSRSPGVGSVAPLARLHDMAVLPGLLWLLVGTGFTVSLPVTFQVIGTGELTRALGGIDLYLGLGLAGCAIALVSFVRNGCRLADDTLADAQPDSMAMVLRHGAYEVAFITVWVAVAYLAWGITTHVTGFDGSQLPVLGIAGVLAGAAIGLIPGCGVQIVFAGLFVAGGVPLPTLVANTISQDGDALLPLLALERRSALLATVITTVPAVIVGSFTLLYF